MGLRLAVDGDLGPKTRERDPQLSAAAGLTAGWQSRACHRGRVDRGGRAPTAKGRHRPAQSNSRTSCGSRPGAGSHHGADRHAGMGALGRGTMKEAEQRRQPVLKEYWEMGVGQPYPGPATAWSAAFVSWVARRAGASVSFR